MSAIEKDVPGKSPGPTNQIISLPFLKRNFQTEEVIIQRNQIF